MKDASSKKTGLSCTRANDFHRNNNKPSTRYILRPMPLRRSRPFCSMKRPATREAVNKRDVEQQQKHLETSIRKIIPSEILCVRSLMIFLSTMKSRTNSLTPWRRLLSTCKTHIISPMARARCSQSIRFWRSYENNIAFKYSGQAKNKNKALQQSCTFLVGVSSATQKLVQRKTHNGP